MKIVIFIVVFISFIEFGFGQNEEVKVDTIYSSVGVAHLLINYKSENESNHLELALKCKEKADSLLKAHFDLKFFNENIILNAESSTWYNINNDARTTPIFSHKKEMPKKVKLVYSIVSKNSDFFNLIEIRLACENEIKIINAFGIPETTDYKINIDYDKAMQIAKKKGFTENVNSDNYEKYSSDRETLSLYFDRENSYQWVLHKRIKKQVGRYGNSFTIKSKALYINAKTGKTKIKKTESVTTVRWF